MFSRATEFVDTEEQRDGWAFGVGFGTQPRYDHLLLMDVKSPRIGKHLNSNFSFVLSAESRQLSALEQTIYPIHVMFESAQNPYKGIVKSYVRLGPGMVFVNNDNVHHDSALFSVQFQFGVEVVTAKVSNGGYGTFFAQSNLNVVFGDNETGTMDAFDGTSILLGARVYFK